MITTKVPTLDQLNEQMKVFKAKEAAIRTEAAGALEEALFTRVNKDFYKALEENFECLDSGSIHLCLNDQPVLYHWCILLVGNSYCLTLNKAGEKHYDLLQISSLMDVREVVARINKYYKLFEESLSVWGEITSVDEQIMDLKDSQAKNKIAA